MADIFNEEVAPDTDQAQRTVMREAEVFRKLRQLCGYVENGSDTVVTLFQDDATRTWVVKVGVESPHRQKPRSYYGPSLGAAIQAAIDAGEGGD